MEFSKQLKRIKSQDICVLLKQKFEAERMGRFFNVDENFEFHRDNLELNTTNSIYLRFRGIDANHPYNLLLVFSLCDERDFNYKIQNSISRVAENNIDKIVIWTRESINPDIVSVLKQRCTDFLTIDSSELEELRFISNFYPIGKDYNYAVTLNKLCDLMILRLKKLFHLVLSEIAAPTYDHDYGSIKIGTKAIMNFEEVIINETIQRLKYEQKHKLGIAVDVGCGTGRHSLNILVKQFDNVFGFDFSPKMIEQAKARKRTTNISNVVFSISDMEYEKVPYEEEFHGKTDLIVASFGMGSFVEDTSKMLRRFYEWLTPGGRIFLSFYNKQSILLKITPSWRDTSLSAHIDTETNTLQVQLDEDTVFQIFCKPYDNNIQSEITKKFEIVDIYSYPTTLALLPNSLLQDHTAEKLFLHVDQKLSKESKQFYGHYVLVVAKKPDIPSVNGYERVIKCIKDNGLPFEVIEHEMVLSVDDVINELSLSEGILVKSVVFSIRGKKNKVVCILPHSERINKHAVANALGVPQSKLKFSTENEILSFGFSIGGIPPFGFPDNEDIQYFAHTSLKKDSNDSVFMGVGDNTKTLKMDIRDFGKLIAQYSDLPTT